MIKPCSFANKLDYMLRCLAQKISVHQTWRVLVQVITEYDGAEIEQVLEVTEKLNAHLTAAVVSNDVQFLGKVGLLAHITCHNEVFLHMHLRDLEAST